MPKKHLSLTALSLLLLLLLLLPSASSAQPPEDPGFDVDRSTRADDRLAVVLVPHGPGATVVVEVLPDGYRVRVEVGSEKALVVVNPDGTVSVIGYEGPLEEATQPETEDNVLEIANALAQLVELSNTTCPGSDHECIGSALIAALPSASQPQVAAVLNELRQDLGGTTNGAAIMSTMRLVRTNLKSN